MKFVILFSLIFIASSSFANLTVTSISGASSTVPSPTAGDTSWTVYGGVQLTRPPSDFGCAVGSTCDTCVGNFDSSTPPLSYPCNPAGVFTSTVLSIHGVPTTAPATGTTPKWLLCDGVRDTGLFSTDLNTDIQVTWGNLCANALSTSSDCSNFSATLTFGLAADCNTLNTSAATDKVSIKFLTRSIDLDPTLTPNTYNPALCSGSTEGACGFSVYPGDKKIYFDSQYVTTVTTTTSNPNVPYTRLVFFSTEQANGETDDATFNRVSTAGDIHYFNIAVDGSSLDGSYIGSLKNDTRYCFKMGSQDAAGNIDHISSSDCTAAMMPNCSDQAVTSTVSNVCMTPSEVVGLLSDKHCFIATAAYGSDMDQHVQLLRQFRNTFMAPHWLGRKFVKLYYAVSPPMAEWISQHDSARAMARWALWPAVGWAEMSLQYGWWMFCAPFLLLGFSFYALRRLRKA